MLGVGAPLVISNSLTSCSSEKSKETKQKQYTPEELGMYSFVDKAPEGKPLKAALVGCGDRGTGAATQFLVSGPDVSIIALADLFPDRMQRCREILKNNHNNEVNDANCFIGDRKSDV